jgi:hypothetical protein
LAVVFESHGSKQLRYACATDAYLPCELIDGLRIVAGERLLEFCSSTVSVSHDGSTPSRLYMVARFHDSVVMEQGNTPARAGSVVKVHVAPDGGGWSVKVEGVEAPVATFRAESDAVMFGRDYAQRHGLYLVLHFSDGRVRFTERPIPRGLADESSPTELG